MPSFNKTDVQLSVADLKRATTSNPRTQQCPAASESIVNIADEFGRGSKDGTLTETRLESFTKNDCHTRFLKRIEYMPILMVRGGEYFFDANTKEKRNRRPARMPLVGRVECRSGSNPGKNTPGASKDYIEPDRNYKPPNVPHALCLTVFLSSRSFVRTPDTATGRIEVSDVKIDVFFNGTFCGSHLVPNRFSSEANPPNYHVVRFTGRRIARLIEKPWVIVPPGQNPDGSPREYRGDKAAYDGAQQRWSDISDGLTAEADRVGRDEQGERPLIGKYLESLAQLSMPPEVEDMQQACSSKFGVFDVVVIYGKGKKHGPDAPYLVTPTPFAIEGFTSIDSDERDSPIRHVTTTSRGTYSLPQSRIEKVLANSKSKDVHSGLSPSSISASSTIPTSSSSNRTKLAAPSPTPQQKRPLPSPPIERSIKRSRLKPSHGVTTKPTVEEEMASIADGKNLAYLDQPRERKRVAYPTMSSDSSPLSEAPSMTRDYSTSTPARSKIVSITLPPSKLRILIAAKGTSPSRMMMDPSGAANKGAVDGGETSATLLLPKHDGTLASESKRRRRTPMKRPESDALDRDFVTPALSVDCIATYAPAGVVRNVGAVRGGVFREDGVVMGARFIVG